MNIQLFTYRNNTVTLLGSLDEDELFGLVMGLSGEDVRVRSFNHFKDMVNESDSTLTNGFLYVIDMDKYKSLDNSKIHKDHLSAIRKCILKYNLKKYVEIL